MSEIYCCSDYHFMHTNIIKYCARPFDNVEHMNAELERRWNELVADDDIVMFIGDLSAGVGKRKDELGQIIQRLKGKKVLIRGNHDHQKDSFYLQSGFKQVGDHAFFNGVLFTHGPAKHSEEHMHEVCHAAMKLKDKYKPVLIIHGHEHKLGPEHEGHYNCASDRHDYRPFTLRSALVASGIESYADEIYEAIRLSVDAI